MLKIILFASSEIDQPMRKEFEKFKRSSSLKVKYDMIIYGGTSTNDKTVHPVPEYTIDKIPFAYTLYFVAAGQTLSTATTVYTPYGIMTLSSPTGEGDVPLGYKQASTLNGQVVNSIASVTSPAGLKNFVADKDLQGDNQLFDLYVVFAPEKLFWMQFFPGDRDIALNSVYSASDLSNYVIASSASDTRMYYAASSYTGATFYFTAEVNVTAVHWPSED